MTIEEYEALEQQRLDINREHLKHGVVFIDIRAAYIDEDVQIGKGTVIYPGVMLTGKVVIGENCIIGQNSKIVDSTLQDDVTVESSYIIESSIGSKTKIGPFAYLRPGSIIGSNCKIGDFVEIKNSSFGDGSKASHLTYVGDSDIGKEVNLGCGVVFVNYDGGQKYRSVVKDGAFIGCNSNLISPIVVEENGYTAAGSTVTGNVPAGALYIARSKGRILEDWVEKRGIFKKKNKK